MRIIVYSVLLIIIFWKTKSFLFSNTKYTNTDIDSLKVTIIKVINSERKENGIPPVKYDSVASISAQYHADEMKKYGFFSHYSIDGIPPYVRYSLKNSGTDAIGENVAIGINYNMLIIGSLKIKGKIDTKKTILELNYQMYNEKPPHNGHRKTILNEHYNGVGIGIAYCDTLVFFVETFTGHYIKFLSRIPDTTFAGNAVDIFGQILYDSLSLSRIEVYYDSIPDSLKEKDSDFFYDSRDSYSYSDDVDFYLKTGEHEINLSNCYNTIDTTGNQFYGSVYTNRRGYYTIVPILSDGSNLFEGANISFFAK